MSLPFGGGSGQFNPLTVLQERLAAYKSGGFKALIATIGIRLRGSAPPPPGQQSIAISVSPTSLPDTGGTVTISGTTTGITGGTNLTLYANGTAVATQPLPSSGSFTWTQTVPPNETRTAITDQFYVTSG